MTEAALTLNDALAGAREQMIQQQLRTWEVLDQQVLQVFATLDRERFVPNAYRSLAYADLPIPLGDDQHMLAPKLAGRIVQALKPGPHDRVLELGTGSGYLAAALGRLACSVRSVEIRAEQATRAQVSLKESGLRNVEVVTGDAYDEASLGERLYDVVVVGGSLPEREPKFEAKVAIGGRLLAVIGHGPIMTAMLFERVSADQWRQSELFETALKPLLGARLPSRFNF
jgi:protein-L-isoaspartate(D-aspartate) O-methyltransferase